MKIKFNHVFICFLLLFIVSRFIIIEIDDYRFTGYKRNKDNSGEISGNRVIEHTKRLIEIGNSRFVYEESRSLAREYIRDQLIALGVPRDNIIWNRFEWSERQAVGKNITTTTWTGINIIVWANSTEIPNQPIRAIGTHYDTLHWGLNRTAGAHDNLAGTGLLIETIALFMKDLKFSQELGIEMTQPTMFIFFDQEEPGALGSKSFVDYARLYKQPNQISFFINIDAVGHKWNRGPIIQTYPYEHQGITRYSPRWLVSKAIGAGYNSGINIGSGNLGLSLLYQAHRYHMSSIPFLSDDGPFSWASVPTLLITDLDIFYNPDPDYHQITDQPGILDEQSLLETSELLLNILSSTSYQYSISGKKTIGSGIKFLHNTIENHPTIRFIFGIFKSWFDNIFSGHHQYLAIGPIVFGYFELLSLNIIMLSYIYFNSFQKYRDIVLLSEETQQKMLKTMTVAGNNTPKKSINTNSDSESIDESDDKETYVKRFVNNNNEKDSNISEHKKVYHRHSSKNQTTTTTSFRGYRILFFHLLALAFISLSDTVFSFELLCLSFISLATIHIHHSNINLFTGFTGGVFCANFIYKDIMQIQKFGRKNTQELSLGILLALYVMHSFLIVIYGYDYYKKNVVIRNVKNQPIKQSEIK